MKILHRKLIRNVCFFSCFFSGTREIVATGLAPCQRAQLNHRTMNNTRPLRKFRIIFAKQKKKYTYMRKRFSIRVPTETTLNVIRNSTHYRYQSINFQDRALPECEKQKKTKKKKNYKSSQFSSSIYAIGYYYQQLKEKKSYKSILNACIYVFKTNPKGCFCYWSFTFCVFCCGRCFFCIFILLYFSNKQIRGVFFMFEILCCNYVRHSNSICD